MARRWVTAAVWALVAVVVGGALVLAALSPLQAFRTAPYMAASLAGVLSLGLLLLQPMLAAGYLPGISAARARRWHNRAGMVLVAAVLVHIAGLYIASPDDALDALLLRAPTAFSIWGVTAMWGVVVTAVLVALRRRIRPALWRVVHNGLALVVVIGTAVHAIEIEGTMSPVWKLLLCGAAVAASVVAVVHVRVARPLLRRRARAAV